MSGLEDKFASNWQDRLRDRLIPDRQVELIPGRKFRFDFYWADARVAVEVQGGVWLPNRGHSGGAGISKDAEKFRLAARQNIAVIPVTTTCLKKDKIDLTMEDIAYTIIEREKMFERLREAADE